MENVEHFKTSINRVRDILRTLGISGMDSLRHICLYILSRYMTRELCTKLDVPTELCWENFMHLIHEVNGGVDKAHDLFYHSELDSCLIKHFDRLFGTTDFPFNVKKAKKHAEILNILDAVNIKTLDRHIDILGFVYELHLKTGASAARDLGQFFTNRDICKYMTALCEPTFKEPGVPESVCDPTMGTGGFLTSFIKYYEITYPDTPIDWVTQEKQINGCDTDPKVAGIARLNLFMETGGCRMSNLLTWDSLYGDLPQVGYDVVLANMPFGLKGIKHEECCKKIQDLKIGGNKSEPLFLQLMCASLNSGGRCAVVVPDGMLTNTSKCHNETRKYLLNNFEVARVVKMSGDFFMNTSIKTSIIFFKNSGTPTTHVEFWEVTKIKTGEIVEELIVDVPRDYFDENCSLNMKLYIAEEEKPVINPEEFPKVKLEDICDYQNGRTTFTRVETGEYDVMGGGMTYIGKTDKYNREGETISISKSGASAGFVAYHSQKYWAGDCLTITPKTDAVQIKYLYYYLKLITNLISSTISGSAIPHCKWNDIKNIIVPLPPIEIQHEIVETLDNVYTSSCDAKKLQANLNAQMVNIMKVVEKRKTSVMKLEDICDYQNGRTTFTRVETGEYDIMGGGMDYIGKTDKYNREGETISISKSGSAGFVAYHSQKYWAGDCLTITPKTDTVLIKYIYYYLKMNPQLTTSNITGGMIPHCKWDNIKNIMIHVPSSYIQKDVIKYLDALQSQINSLEQLQRQSENNARFILESYLPKSDVDNIEETIV